MRGKQVANLYERKVKVSLHYCWNNSCFNCKHWTVVYTLENSLWEMLLCTQGEDKLFSRALMKPCSCVVPCVLETGRDLGSWTFLLLWRPKYFKLRCLLKRTGKGSKRKNNASLCNLLRVCRVSLSFISRVFTYVISFAMHRKWDLLIRASEYRDNTVIAYL